MRFALITGRRHDAEAFATIVQPGDPREVGAEFKRLVTAETSEFAEIQLWDSHCGIEKKKKFDAPAAAPAPAAEPAPAEPSPLLDLTVEELRAHCEELGIETSGFRLKADFVQAIELDDKLSESTVPELRAKAVDAGLEVSGLYRKREFLDLLEKHERVVSEKADRDAADEAAKAAGGSSTADADDANQGPQAPGQRRKR